MQSVSGSCAIYCERLTPVAASLRSLLGLEAPGLPEMIYNCVQARRWRALRPLPAYACALATSACGLRCACSGPSGLPTPTRPVRKRRRDREAEGAPAPPVACRTATSTTGCASTPTLSSGGLLRSSSTCVCSSCGNFEAGSSNCRGGGPALGPTGPVRSTATPSWHAASVRNLSIQSDGTQWCLPPSSPIRPAAAAVQCTPAWRPGWNARCSSCTWTGTPDGHVGRCTSNLTSIRRACDPAMCQHLPGCRRSRRLLALLAVPRGHHCKLETILLDCSLAGCSRGRARACGA